MPALEGPVLFRTIAGLALRDPLLSAAPNPERVSWALLVSRVASWASRAAVVDGIGFLFGFARRTQRLREV
jgi:hypothetical protein